MELSLRILHYASFHYGTVTLELSLEDFHSGAFTLVLSLFQHAPCTFTLTRVHCAHTVLATYTVYSTATHSHLAALAQQNQASSLLQTTPPYTNMASINMPSQLHTSMDCPKRLLRIAQMEACDVPRVKRVGNLRAAFQAEELQMTSPVSIRSSNLGLASQAEHAFKRISLESAYTRPIVRQDSFIVSEHHTTKFQSSEPSQSVQVDYFSHMPGLSEDERSLSANTVHGVSFRFPDAEFDLALPSPRIKSNRGSCLSIHFHNGISYQHRYQNHCPHGNLFISDAPRLPRPLPHLLHTSFDGEEHIRYLIALNHPDWIRKEEVDYIDHTPLLRRAVSKACSKIEHGVSKAAVVLGLENKPLVVPTDEMCYTRECKLGICASSKKGVGET
jgi:hypothetical protein